MIVCSSANNLVKMFEKYVKYMDIFRPFSSEVFTSLMYLIKYYVYSVFHLFANPHHVQAFFFQYNPHLIKEDEIQTTLLENYHAYYVYHTEYKTLRSYLLKMRNYFESYFTSQQDIAINTVFPATRSSITQEFTERAVAIESVEYILYHLKLLLPAFRHLLPQTAKFEENVTELQDNLVYLRAFVYSSLIPELYKTDNIFSTIPSMKWDLKEGAEVNNFYVERIVYFMQDQSEKLKCLGGGCLPASVQAKIMDEILEYTMKQLVDCYSKIKKCSNFGRKVLLDDFRKIISEIKEKQKIEKIDLTGYVEEYIKAFSLEAEELVDFIIKNKHYPLNYLLQLFHQNISISMLKKKITSEYLERIQLEYLSYLKMVVDDK
eukprot:TRINITY_DN8745_c0_g1_i2.p1 TRINITY_DN8745_c0_g1~~TRINITY_DN8745_c0_g1_i2.p1  ORF type:complete len:376 (-),score=93.79 TRINITY_DN8745_c0_g1_i2:171-1298(-)